MHQFVFFIKLQNFDTTVIKCFTVSSELQEERANKVCRHSAISILSVVFFFFAKKATFGTSYLLLCMMKH